MRVAVIGAGPSGLSTAAVLTACGHDVVLFEAAPDLGGVWSATRAYPGVATQDDSTSYAFSDTPMPADLPEHPRGDQVRAHLHAYACSKGLLDRLHLSTRVVSAEPFDDGGADGEQGWSVTTTGPHPRTGTTATTTHAVDWLVLATGVFSTPHVPDWPGRAAFEAAGGRVLEPTRLGDGAALAGRRVVVVGWGKTACDVAVASAGSAASTTVLARALRWKVPKRLGGGLTFRHLLLTRAGEHLLAPRRDTSARRALALAGAPVRRVVTWLLAQSIARRCGLRELGLLPSLSLPHSDSLVTDGFFEAVRAGRLAVRRETSVRSLEVVDGEPHVLLADGQRLPADVVVAATGFDQDISLLPPAVRAALLDDDGVMALDRRILPLRVPRLAFAGWGNTYRSPLTAEVGAVWLAAHLAGELRPRRRADVERTAERYHLTHRQAAAHGEPQLPSGSFGALDDLLADLRLPLPRRVRRRQWTRPLTPDTYRYLLPALQRRLVARGLLDAAVPRPREPQVHEAGCREASVRTARGVRSSRPDPASRA